MLAEMGVDGAHPGGFELTRNILSKLNIDGYTSLLDVGCGTGQTAAYIADQYGATVTAIDIHPIMIEKAKERFSTLTRPVRLHHTSVETLPFADEQFDIALCESVLAFVSLPQALGEIYRVLKQGGMLVAIEACHSQLSDEEKQKIASFYSFRHLLTKQEWEKELQKYHFQHIDITYSSARQPDAAQTPFLITANIPLPMLKMLETHQRITNRYGNQLGYCVFSCQK
jgi:ubiquinone/menaquinone biosynthesis C-methylase UbiE